MNTTTYGWDTYPLRPGTETQHGTIEQVGWTAYKINGEWLAHDKIHGPRKWAEPMVVLT